MGPPYEDAVDIVALAPELVADRREAEAHAAREHDHRARNVRRRACESVSGDADREVVGAVAVELIREQLAQIKVDKNALGLTPKKQRSAELADFTEEMRETISELGYTIDIVGRFGLHFFYAS